MINCWTVYWFREWPEEALIIVAKNILEQKDDIALGKLIFQVAEALAIAISKIKVIIKENYQRLKNVYKVV